MSLVLPLNRTEFGLVEKVTAKFDHKAWRYLHLPEPPRLRNVEIKFLGQVPFSRGFSARDNMQLP